MNMIPSPQQTGFDASSLILPGMGMVSSALMTWYGIQKQQEQADEALETQKEELAQDRQTQAHQFEEGLKLKKADVSQARANMLNQIKWKEADEKFQKQQLLANRVLSMINSQPALQQAVFSKIAAQKQLAAPTNYAALNPIRM